MRQQDLPQMPLPGSHVHEVGSILLSQATCHGLLSQRFERAQGLEGGPDDRKAVPTPFHLPLITESLVRMNFGQMAQRET